jgi:cytochrome c-type biogenesis protein CcmH/NrfG
MGSSTSVVFARELKYLQVRRRLVSPQQVTQETRNLLRSASILDEHILQARILLATCLISEKMVLEAAEELEDIEAWSPRTVDTMENQKSLVALKLSLSMALGELGDTSSMAKAREILDSLIDLVCATYHGHILRIILGP